MEVREGRGRAGADDGWRYGTEEEAEKDEREWLAVDARGQRDKEAVYGEEGEEEHLKRAF